jgi:UDP-N-acetylmuramyl pentapeptide phosphotransferase/UDP-N-acetylglucosamine-1-phosphate transferase
MHTIQSIILIVVLCLATPFLLLGWLGELLVDLCLWIDDRRSARRRAKMLEQAEKDKNQEHA